MCAWLQVFLARGLQLEKTTKAANVQYILVLFSPPAFSSNLYSDQLLPALVFRNLDIDNLWDASNVQFR